MQFSRPSSSSSQYTSETSLESSSEKIHQAVSAWFLGPQAENAGLLKELFSKAVSEHVDARAAYHPEDGAFITHQVMSSEVYQNAVNRLRQKFADLSTLMNDYSIPFYSPRYGAHMTFESSLPSIVGWLSGLLLNPNNVTFEAGPITTLLEHEVGHDLCKMIGFKNEGDLQSWAHLTCDGTVANVEFIWAARNLKFYPLALRDALQPNKPLNFIADTFRINVPPSNAHNLSSLHLLKDLTTWQLLNLPPHEVLGIPDRLRNEYGVTSQFLESVLSHSLVQSTGLAQLGSKWGIKESPKILVSGTKHYSWPKGIALTGIGSDNLIDIPVDHNARIDLDALRLALDHCLNNHHAVYAVVAVMGSTEEGAVDPLAKMLQIRDEYQARGLSFLVHADAAWGGYFCSTLRDAPADWETSWPVPKEGTDLGESSGASSVEEYVPYTAMKQYTVHQLEALHGADSVTIDPHKSGYCPYPAGGLCYKDRRMRHLLTWSAPYIQHGKRGGNIGIHGVEGSKPGAVAASVYMHHSVVGLHKGGHGALLGEVSFTCARIAAYWATLSTPSTPFTITPFNKLRSEPHEEAIEAEKEFIRSKILGRSNEEIMRDPDPEVMVELRSLGSDLNINAFVCNFRLSGSGSSYKPGPGSADPDIHDAHIGALNEDISEANYLNQCIFDQLSVNDIGQNPKSVPLFLSATVLKPSEYGECLRHFKMRAGLETESESDLFVLRNVVMSPFQSSPEFVETMAVTFREILENNVKLAVARNTITPQIHTFIVQGTDRLFLAYRPLFHKANCRQQLILEVAAPRSTNAKGQGKGSASRWWDEYQRLRQDEQNSNAIWTLKTAQPVILADVLSGAEVKCIIHANDKPVLEVTISNPRIVKDRPLLSRWHDKEYDAKYTPFYLYGTPEQLHIDHMLLRAPNAQLTAEGVELVLDEPPTKVDSDDANRTTHDDQNRHALSKLATKLSNGLLLYVTRPERSFQPFDTHTTSRFFYPNATYKVMICDDPFPASAHGPGLAAALDHYPVLAHGTLKLPLNVFKDCVEINRQDFRDNQRIYPPSHDSNGTAGPHSSVTMSWADKAGWRAMVKDRLNINRAEYYTTSKERMDGRFGDGRDISKHPLLDLSGEEDRDVVGAGLFS